MKEPSNWSHKSGYYLNAGGKSIEYEHDNKPYLAIVECLYNPDSMETEYYTVIFDESTETSMKTVEPHQIWHTKEKAQNKIVELMEKHN
jgi:hypothetical protein